MSMFHRLLVPAAAMCLLAACGKSEAPAPATAPASSSATAADADAFIAKYNDDYRKMYPDIVAAQWVQSNFITDDTQLLASRANERSLAYASEVSQAAKPFYALKDLKPETARALNLIRVGAAAPESAAEREEVAKLGSKMEANYGTGKWCHLDETNFDRIAEPVALAAAVAEQRMRRLVVDIVIIMQG